MITFYIIIIKDNTISYDELCNKTCCVIIILGNSSFFFFKINLWTENRLGNTSVAKVITQVNLTLGHSRW